MLLCRSVFSDQPKTHTCLRVREALSVSVHTEGEGACDDCMYGCVCRLARAVRGGLGGQPDGDCRARESGHCLAILSIPLPHVCLSISPAWGLGQRVYLPVPLHSTHPHLLCLGFYKHEGRTDKRQQAESPSQRSA